MSRKPAARLLGEPLLHFLVLGLLLFLAQPAISFWLPLSTNDRGIAVTQADLNQLQRNWQAQTGRPPSPVALQALIEEFVDREILFREALRRNLHRFDSVVRERLIRNMRFAFPGTDMTGDEAFERALSLGMAGRDLVARRRLIQRMQHAVESRVRIDEGELNAYFLEHASRYTAPPRYNLHQKFFSTDLRGSEAQADARSALQALKSSAPPAVDADGFLHGNQFRHITGQQAGELLGEEIAAALPTLPVGQWTGPHESIYGQHLIRVTAVTPPSIPALDAVRNRVKADLFRDREQQQLRDWLGEQRSRYRVIGARASA